MKNGAAVKKSVVFLCFIDFMVNYNQTLKGGA